MIRYIVEQAFSKRLIRDKLYEKLDVAIEHLIKLYAWRHDTENKEGWMKSVYAAIDKIDKLKGSNKYPSPDWMYQNTWGNAKDMITRDIEALNDETDPRGKYPDYPTIDIDDNIRKFIDEYFVWLSIVLSSTGKVSTPRVYDKIEELLNKYPLK